MKQLNLVGQRFGRWVAQKRASKPSYWTCVCDCGNIVDVFLGSLRSGRSKGCHPCQSLWMKESGQASINATKHGMHRSSEYCSWHSMKGRCLDERNHNFDDYGGRGITICDSWKGDFKAFFYDMGEKPPGHTLDRIDPNGDYEPGNCRWATVKEQNRNKRNSKNIMVTIDGESMLLLEALDKYGNVIKYISAQARICRGWDHKRAVSEPPRSYTHKSR